MEKKRHMKRNLLFVGVLFLLIYLPGLIMTPQFVLKHHLGAGRNAIYSRIACEPANSLDVLVMGDSESYTSVSPMKLWKENGYTVYAAGQPGANLGDTRNVLEVALESQKPKVILLETHSLFRLRKGKINQKQSALAEKLYNAFPVLRYHNAWKQFFPQRLHASYKGFNISGKVKPYKGCYDYMKKNQKPDGIDKENLHDLKAIQKVCQKNNIQLILYSAPSPKNYSMTRNVTLTKLAKKMNLPYVDLNLKTKELGIDWTTDTRDHGDHLNISGALKTTAFIQKYLAKHCNLPDHRKDSLVASKWNKTYTEYAAAEEKKLNRINGKKSDTTENTLIVAEKDSGVLPE